MSAAQGDDSDVDCVELCDGLSNHYLSILQLQHL